MAIPAESFFLVAGSVGTLQHQIRQMVTEGILSGRFRVGGQDAVQPGAGRASGDQPHYGDAGLYGLGGVRLSDIARAVGVYLSDGAPKQRELQLPPKRGNDLVDYAAGMQRCLTIGIGGFVRCRRCGADCRGYWVDCPCDCRNWT